MIKSLLILIAFSLTQTSFAQTNLILNPSFEDSTGTMWQYSNSDPNYYHICKYWDNPNYSTTDYGFNLPGAKNGIAFIGLACYESSFNNVREYAQGELTSTLISGNTYDFSVYVRLDTVSKFKLCSLEVAFLSARQYTPVLTPFSFSNTISIDVSAAITNTWAKCSATFTANGGEKYLIIGSFKSDAMSCASFYTNSPNSEAAYYNLDTLTLINSDLSSVNEQTPKNDFAIYPNPASNFINLEIGDVESIKIYNCNGDVVLYEELINRRKLDLRLFNEGIYTLIISSRKKTISKRIIVLK